MCKLFGLRANKSVDVSFSFYEMPRKSFEELAEDAKLLGKHYSPPRYPSLHSGIEAAAHELYTRRDAEACASSATKILNSVKELLKQLSSTC